MSETMDFFTGISGGRLLDVATGSGSFIQFLLENLTDVQEVIGIDTNERAATAFAEAFREAPIVRFEQVDALHTPYPEASFDTISISNSLHHFDAPQAVLAEMLRLLRPGGHLLAAEMFADGQTETQLTHVLLHHWWAQVDRVNGIVHHPTFTRDELVHLVDCLGLEDLRFFEISDTDSDPHDPQIVQELAPVFERYLQRADGHPDLQELGRELRARVESVGFHSATSLLVRGRKPGAGGTG